MNGRGLLTTTIGLLALGAASAPSALAAQSCTPDGTTLRVMLSGSQVSTLSRSGAGRVLLGTTDCGALSAFDAITVTGDGLPQTLRLSLAGGAFAPGKTAEPSGDSEIEIGVALSGGSDVVDVITGSGGRIVQVGTAGVRLGTDDDIDITASGVERWRLTGSEVGDLLSAAGGAALGLPLPVGATIRGGAGNDVLQGGAAADGITAGAGTDTVAGGPGNDTIDPLGGGADTLAGGPGTDVVTYAGSATRVLASPDAVRNDGLDASGDGVPEDPHSIAKDVERIIGGSADDVLDASAGGQVPQVLEGRGGSDRLVGGTLADTLLGGDLNDVLTGGDGPDQLRGGLGNDTHNGGPGDDDLLPETTLDGSDTFRGDSGRDRLIASRAVRQRWSLDNVRNDGIDAAADGTAEEADDLRADVEVIHGGSGPDFIDGRAVGFGLLLYSKEGNDIVYGGSGADFLSGGGGADWLLGTGGNDELSDGEGEDLLAGGEGNDFLHVSGTGSGQKLYGDGGNDRLIGWDGNDQLHGGTGDDVIVNVLVSAYGNDTITGGAGTDRIEWSQEVGFPLTITLDGVANDGYGPATSSRPSDVDNIAADIETFRLGAGSDRFTAPTGGTLPQVVAGGSGADTISTGGGNDVLIGESGTDTLTGGEGDDRFQAKEGTKDTLSGGNGNDTGTWDAGLDAVTSVTMG